MNTNLDGAITYTQAVKCSSCGFEESGPMDNLSRHARALHESGWRVVKAIIHTEAPFWNKPTMTGDRGPGSRKRDPNRTHVNDNRMLCKSCYEKIDFDAIRKALEKLLEEVRP